MPRAILHRRGWRRAAAIARPDPGTSFGVEVGGEKEVLRRRMRARLAALPPTSVADRAGRVVAERVTGGARWRDARTVAVFASLPGEIPTGPLIQAAWTSGRRVLLPRVIAKGALSFHVHVQESPLEPGTFGVAEPSASAAEASLTEADLVFVPGLAFDRRGGRLGRGAGYYDRALAEALGGDTPRWRAGETATIGLAFAMQIVDAVPMEPHDVPLDAVITESASFGDL